VEPAMPDAAGAAVMEEISTRVVPSNPLKQVFDFRKLEKLHFRFFEIRKVAFSFGVMPTPIEKTRFHTYGFSISMKTRLFINRENYDLRQHNFS
jgi:hypothetical protein